jgi:hypothetical protein
MNEVLEFVKNNCYGSLDFARIEFTNEGIPLPYISNLVISIGRNNQNNLHIQMQIQTVPIDTHEESIKYPILLYTKNNEDGVWYFSGSENVLHLRPGSIISNNIDALLKLLTIILL